MAKSRAMFRQFFRRKPLGLFCFQPCVPRLRSLMGLNARGTKHDNGVADAFPLELHERM